MGSSGLVQQRASLPARRVRHAPPAISRPVLQWFLRYARFYVGRHMHSVRVSQEQNLQHAYGQPLLLYMNHPSWWDPMIAAVLASCYLPDYLHYTPIDAAALQQYRFFQKLGFFGMTRNSFESQRRLLDIAGQVLSGPRSALWVTPQGRFSDVRERPLCLGKGLLHIVSHAPDCLVLPIALEYCFWEESKPEALVRFGDPVYARDLRTRSHCERELEANLQSAMDALKEAAIARDESAFRIVLRGNGGVGGVYDLWRRAKALLQGRTFHPEHGDRRG